MAKGKRSRTRNASSKHAAGFRMEDYDRPDVPDYVVVKLRSRCSTGTTSSSPSDARRQGDHRGRSGRQRRRELRPVELRGQRPAEGQRRAADCLQGRALARNGAPLSPNQVRKILKHTGTPQEPGPGVPLIQRIGSQPNLAKALAQV